MTTALIAGSFSLEAAWLASLRWMQDQSGFKLPDWFTLTVFGLSGMFLAMASIFDDLDAIEGLWVGVALIALYVGDGLWMMYRIAIIAIVSMEIIAATHL